MILSKAVQAPRASMEEQSLGWEEVQAWFKRVFTAGEAIEGSQGNAEHLSPVAAAHRILTNSFGLIPFGAYRKDGDARVPYNDERLRTILKVRPNDCMSPFMLRKVLMSNAFWHGFGAVWNRRDSSGRVVQRLPLPTECCSILKDREGGQYWYQYNVDGMVKKFSNYELSFLFFETYDGIHGRGFLHLAREAIAVDAMAQRYGKKFYQNGARLSGIVEIDSDADRKTRDKVKAEFQSYATDDAFAVAVLDRDMKYTPLGLNQRDSQFIESREFSVEEVARFSGVPKHMSGFASTGFALAGDRLLTDAVIAGNGSGKPLGFINSKALITVDKEPSQTAGTFVGNNAVKMQARSMPRGRERLVWLMHPDAEEQLPLLVIKGGDESKFLWTPEGGLGNFDTQRVLHKPVLFEDSCSALGTKGDIMLVDPFQYILLTKGAVKQDWSIHVEFLTDQNCFRVVFRCNGAPKVNSPLKIKNSTKLRSPFVALADRK